MRRREKKTYLNVEEKKSLEISHECAQIYFEGIYLCSPFRKYIESASYVLYNDGSEIISIHKTTGKKSVIIKNLEYGLDLIDKKRIAVYADMVYYMRGNDLYYLDLNTRESGHITHIEEKKNKNGDKHEVRDLCVYKAQKLIYRNGSYCIADLKQGVNSESTFEPGSESSHRCFLRGDHLYYLDSKVDMDDVRKKGLYVQYRLRRYGILNGQATDASESFGKHEIMDSITAKYSPVSEGMHENYYYVIFEYSGMGASERVGFDCFFINVDSPELAKAHKFYIWNSHVYQIEQHKNYLIYVNASRKYSLIKHDFLTDKKSRLLKGYGKSDKSTFSERFFEGKSKFQHPDNYMRLGRWLWVCESGKWTPRIISV